jgi:hypothetical protein
MRHCRGSQAGASGPNKKGYSHETSTQKGELDNSSKPNQIKGKRQSPPEKNTTDKKKELLTLASCDVCRWEMLKTMMMMMSENQLSQSQVHVTAFWGTEGEASKSQFK